MALSRPERFVYKVGETTSAEPWRLNQERTGEAQKSYRRFDKESVGGVVAISGNHIANFSVHNVSKALIEEIASDNYDAEEEG